MGSWMWDYFCWDFGAFLVVGVLEGLEKLLC